jgi:methionyl-tRNA formyltransferase
VLLTGSKKHLSESAVSFAQQFLNVLALVGPDAGYITEQALADLRPDYVFSFLNDRILKGPLLNCRNVNFHPAPPEWPGRGSASLAIFHGSTVFGATAHVMTAKVDAGSILAVKRFTILPEESCESLFSRAEHACLDLFFDVLTHVAQHGVLPDPTGVVWRGKAMSRKEFEQWLVLDPSDHDAFMKKIKAARHSRFPGPYVIIHGQKFGLVNGAA